MSSRILCQEHVVTELLAPHESSLNNIGPGGIVAKCFCKYWACIIPVNPQVLLVQTWASGMIAFLPLYSNLLCTSFSSTLLLNWAKQKAQWRFIFWKHTWNSPNLSVVDNHHGACLLRLIGFDIIFEMLPAAFEINSAFTVPQSDLWISTMKVIHNFRVVCGSNFDFSMQGQYVNRFNVWLQIFSINRICSKTSNYYSISNLVLCIKAFARTSRFRCSPCLLLRESFLIWSKWNLWNLKGILPASDMRFAMSIPICLSSSIKYLIFSISSEASNPCSW